MNLRHLMNTFTAITSIILSFLVIGIDVQLNPNSSEKLPEVKTVLFTYTSDTTLTLEEKSVIEKVLTQHTNQVSMVLTKLPDTIMYKVNIVDHNLDIVKGVSGMTLRHKMNALIQVDLSSQYPGGVVKAGQDGLKSLLWHELHHVQRGWSIEQNEFEQGIDIAAINEGLAVVFAEEYTGESEVVNSKADVTDAWVDEILQLPKEADYMTWVSGIHPDGRSYIGYRTGNYIIRKAMEKSSKSILALSELSPTEIFELAGY